MLDNKILQVFFLKRKYFSCFWNDLLIFIINHFKSFFTYFVMNIVKYFQKMAEFPMR